MISRFSAFAENDNWVRANDKILFDYVILTQSVRGNDILIFGCPIAKIVALSRNCLFFHCERGKAISKPLKNKRLLRHFVSSNDTIIVFRDSAIAGYGQRRFSCWEGIMFFSA